MAHTNAAGQAILGAGDYLKKVAGRLCASDPRVNQTLHKAFAAAAEGDAAVGTQGIAVPLVAHDGARHVAHVLPLTRSIGRRVARDAVAAVFVRKAALDAPAAPEVIARTYRLTPTELRVLLTIVEVGGVPETADTLGIADSTVKTHLSNVYAKTGTRRQTDLVRLVAGFANPLRK